MSEAIRTANFQTIIESVATGFQITIYSNRVLVIISQTQTFGSVLLTRYKAKQSLAKCSGNCVDSLCLGLKHCAATAIILLCSCARTLARICHFGLLKRLKQGMRHVLHSGFGAIGC